MRLRKMNLLFLDKTRAKIHIVENYLQLFFFFYQSVAFPIKYCAMNSSLLLEASKMAKEGMQEEGKLLAPAQTRAL